MNIRSYLTGIFFTTLLGLFLVIPAISLAAPDQTSGQDVQMAQGSIKQFDQKTLVITVEVVKGEKQKFFLNSDTALVGYASLADVAKRHKVKIWYVSSENGFSVVKLEKKLIVGC